MKILVTGATGYVGSKLVPQLLKTGHEVTCMVRNHARISNLAFSDLAFNDLAFNNLAFNGARVVEGDALDPATLSNALSGIDCAYYLIHSMGGADAGFAQLDLRAASNFARAAKRAGVSRIIYLGGLTSQTSEVSPHLKSRQDTGAALRDLGPPLTEFRAGIIVGNGSLSFEMIRYLSERLPVMICPRWVVTRTQPIYIDNVIEYLVAALEVPESAREIIEIGGATVETYRSMMLRYAQIRRLRRWLIRVPVLTPKLSSYWLNLVTPIPASIARPLIEGLRTEVICTSSSAKRYFPAIIPISYSAAVKATLNRRVPDESFAAAIPADSRHVTVKREGLICDIRQTAVNASAQRVFALLQSLGGKTGWLYADWLWKLRGLIDSSLGGVGMRPGVLATGVFPKVGDHIDFWQLKETVFPQRLLLQADMKLPGRAWLQFVVTPLVNGKSLVQCRAWFEPRGLAGEAYWWLLYPIHAFIFRGMLQAIQTRCEILPKLTPTPATET